MKIFLVSIVLTVLAVVAAVSGLQFKPSPGFTLQEMLHPGKAVSRPRKTEEAEIFELCSVDEDCTPDRFCYKGWCRVPPPPIGESLEDGRLEDARSHGGRPTEESLLIIHVIKNTPHNIGRKVHSCETSGCPPGQRCRLGECVRYAEPQLRTKCSCPSGQHCTPDGCKPDPPAAGK